MSQPPSNTAGPVPRWLVIAGSVAIVFHLLAVGAVVLGAPSGPWWVPQFGPSPALPPKFAEAVNNVTAPNYLLHVKLVHNYHFSSNRPGMPGAQLEVRLKFKDGEVKTLHFPDKDANPWVRYRQQLLIQALADDMPVPPPQGESIAPPGAQVNTVQFWDMTPPDRVLRLVTRPEHLVPRNREVSRPSEWSLLLARSYGRYLCREYGAESAELIRHTQPPLPPAVLFMDRPPPQDAFAELTANFGEFSK